MFLEKSFKIFIYRTAILTEKLEFHIIELLKNNVSIDIIKKSTNLSNKEIEKLKQKLTN